MAYDAIPPDLLELLQEFEIYGKGRSDLFQSRHNIVLDDISTEDLMFGTIMTGIPIMAEGATKDMFQAGFFPIGADQTLSIHRNNVLLTMGTDDIPTTGKVLLWNVRDGFEEIFPHPIHWICDADTMVIPLESRGTQHVKVFEMFAGGYGGWVSSFKYLRSQQRLQCQVIGIEDDFETALAYSVNHSATLVDGLHALPRGIFKSTANDHITHGNIRSKNWWKAIADWSPHIVTISSPCPPWTGASHSPGLQSSQGMLLPEALILLRIFRPPLVAIEQVHGFATHPHRKHCIGVLKSSGYEIAFARVVDSAEFGACHRLRWLCIAFRRNASNVQIKPVELWPNMTRMTPRSLNAVLECFDADDQLAIDEHTLDVACDFKYVPKAKKVDFLNDTREAVFSYRCFGEMEQHPTFMAQYGNQQNLDLRYLEEKGLFAHFCKRASGCVRFLHPLEIAMMHVSFERLWVSHDYGFAWKLIGNCITLPHALLLTANMINMLPDFRKTIQISKVFQHLFKESMNGHHIMRVENSFGAMFFDNRIHDQEEYARNIIHNLERLRSCLTGHFLPKNMCWNPVHGILHAMDEQGCAEVSVGIESVVELAMTPVTQLQETQTIEDTQPYIPVLKAVIELHDMMGEFWVAGDFPLDELDHVFDGHFDRNLCNHEHVQCRLTRTDMIRIHENGAPRSILIVQDSQLTIIKGDQKDTLHNLLNKCGIVSEFFDIFGKIMHEQTPMPYQIVMDHPIKYSSCIDVIYLLAAFQNTSMSFYWMVDVWEFHIRVKGEGLQQQYVADFWKNLMHETLQSKFGIHTDIQHEDDVASIVYSGGKVFMPIPQQTFALALSVSAAKAILDSMCSEKGIHIQIKWLDRILWKGLCCPEITVESLANLLTFALVPSHHGVGIRLITAGKTYYNIGLKELRDDLMKERLNFHLVVGLHGGGAKDNQKILTKNSIATTLLEQGFAIEWVSSTVDQVLNQVGIKKISQIAQLPAGTNRVEQILNICRECQITIPNKIKDKASSVITTGIGAKQRKKTPVQPSAQHYTIETEFFVNEDGSMCAQLQEVRQGQNGIVLIDHDKAVPWLRESSLLSHDECALLIIGKHDIASNLKSEVVNVPCVDQMNRPTILLCTMVQLGQKQVALKKTVNQPVSHEDCQVVSITLWKSDFNLKDWEQITDQTIPFIRRALGDDQLADCVIAMWGRSFRNQQKQPSNAHHSVSVQVHATIKRNKLQELLKISGFNRLFIVPKDEQGRISQQWRIVWTEGDMAHLQSLATKTCHCMGLVKAESKLGLRYTREHFADAWAVIHPQKEKPLDMIMKFIYRIEPLPYGTTAENLLEWSKVVAWSFRPIKAVGPKAWIIGADSQPKDAFMQFNGYPLLLKLLPPRHAQSSNAVIAGPRPTRDANRHAGKGDDLHFDPWAQYQPNHAAPVGQSSREVSGPTQKKFDEQDAKLNTLEQALTKLQVETEKGFDCINQKHDEAQQKLVGTLANMKQEIDTSVAQAMKTQSTQLESTLGELKALFLQNQAKAKRSRSADEDEEMDGR